MGARRGILIGGILAAVAAAALGGWLWWRDARHVERTDNAFIEADMVSVGPRLDGWVVAVPARENHAVRRGDPLAVLDDTDLSARLAEAEAAVEVARAAVASAESRAALQGAFIAEAAAAVEGAEAELSRAEADHARVKTLLTGDIASRRTLEATDADRRKALAERARLRAALTAVEEQRTVLAADTAEALARLRQAEAALDLLRTDRDKLTIRAPADGMVGHVTVRPGEYVTAGRQLMVLVPRDTLHVVANFKETQIARMRPGQRVDITVDAVPGRVLVGRIDSFAPASGALFSVLRPENATGNFTKVVQRLPVRIALDPVPEAEALLKPGLSAAVRVDTRDPGGPAP